MRYVGGQHGWHEHHRCIKHFWRWFFHPFSAESFNRTFVCIFADHFFRPHTAGIHENSFCLPISFMWLSYFLFWFLNQFIMKVLFLYFFWLFPRFFWCVLFCFCLSINIVCDSLFSRISGFFLRLTIFVVECKGTLCFLKTFIS